MMQQLNQISSALFGHLFGFYHGAVGQKCESEVLMVTGGPVQRRLVAAERLGAVTRDHLANPWVRRRRRHSAHQCTARW